MSFVDYVQKDAIGIITVNRPEALNALSDVVMDDMNKVLDGIDASTVRCIVLTGAGNKSFVAGADISEMLPLTKAQGKAWGEKGNAVFRRIELLPMPVIAAVNGFALGGGCELALSCDIRIASDNARFAQPEVGLGITAGFGGTQRLPRTIGVGKAKEMLYTGNMINAARALEIGLVNAVYTQEELMDEAMKLAQKIASMAPIAVRNTKRAIDDGLQGDIDSGIAIEAQRFGDCFETSDQKNGMSAFVEKRKPEPFTNS